MGQEADVSTRSIKSKKSYDERYLVRTLMGGTKAMVNAGEDFTPKYPGESQAGYESRLRETRLFNGFDQTIKKSAGKVLSKQIVLNDDVPADIKDYALNFDGQGRNITSFTLDSFSKAMVDGYSFVFVDFPVVTPAIEGGPVLLTDQIEQKARPYAISYTADQMLGYKHKNVGGTEEVTEIRFYECLTESSGQWGEKEVEQIRVLRPGSFEIWQNVETGTTTKEWQFIKGGFTSLSYIPVVPIYVNRREFMMGSPPFQSLAEMNLEHWISSSDQRKALKFARFGMLAFSGVQKGTITEIGPDIVIELSEPEAKWGKIETAGEGLTAGFTDLDKIKERMESAGMMVNVQDKNGIVTATAASINSDDANSALLAAATALQDSIDQILQMFADYLGLPNGGTCEVNKSFGMKLSTLSATDLVQLFNAGILDGETILDELKKRGDLSSDLDIAEVARRVRENTPVI